MGIYQRKDSPFYWLLLERRGRPGLRQATRIPSRDVAPNLAKEFRRQAHALYLAQMAELARLDASVSHVRAEETKHLLKPLRRSPARWCYVYILQQGELVKVGRSVNPTRRLKTLQTGNGATPQVLAVFPAHAVIETAIHDRFSYLRDHGEWFRVDSHLMAFIEGVQGGRNPIALLWGPDEEQLQAQA